MTRRQVPAENRMPAKQDASDTTPAPNGEGAHILPDIGRRPLEILSEGISLAASDRKQLGEALEQSEQRFTRFMEQLPGLAWIKDLQGRYLYANDMALKVFQCSRERLYGNRDEDVFDPQTAEQFR